MKEKHMSRILFLYGSQQERHIHLHAALTGVLWGQFMFLCCSSRGRESDPTRWSPVTTDRRSADAAQSRILFPRWRSAVLNFSKRHHTSGHDNMGLLWTKRNSCLLHKYLPAWWITVLLLFFFLFASDSGFVFSETCLWGRGNMTRSQVDRPGVRQLNAPCCSG